MNFFQAPALYYSGPRVVTNGGIYTLPAICTGLAFGNGVFVTIGRASGPYYSANGIDWTPSARPHAVLGDCGVYSQTGWFNLTFVNGRFICVVLNTWTLYESLDGINWTQHTIPSDIATGFQANKIVYGNGVYLLTHYPNPASTIAYTSTDLVTWTKVTMPSTSSIYTAAFGGPSNLFVVVENSAALNLWTSPNAVTWTKRTIPATMTYGVGMVYDNGIFLVGQQAGNRVHTSPDGITWTFRNTTTMYPVAGAYCPYFRYGNGKWYSVGRGSGPSFSCCWLIDPTTDTWTANTAVQTAMAATPVFYTVDAAYGNGTWLMIDYVGVSNRVMAYS